MRKDKVSIVSTAPSLGFVHAGMLGIGVGRGLLDSTTVMGATGPAMVAKLIQP